MALEVNTSVHVRTEQCKSWHSHHLKYPSLSLSLCTTTLLTLPSPFLSTSPTSRSYEKLFAVASSPNRGNQSLTIGPQRSPHLLSCLLSISSLFPIFHLTYLPAPLSAHSTPLSLSPQLPPPCLDVHSKQDDIRENIKRQAEADASNYMARHSLLGSVGVTLNTITPCAACKLLRRRCAQECPFSPYFSPHEPQKFASVHKVFGASNVSKMLMEVPESQRADAANSLVYEANVRLRDPVYGCMGAITALQRQVQALEVELAAVRTEILKHKYRHAGVHAVLFASSTDVSVAAPPPIHGLPPPPPPPLPAVLRGTISSAMYPPAPSSSTDYSSITNENVTYFG
ncbi:hypothetical protein M5K25_006991 [Dendrobium thyrsiflorum]|uniref:LOB domain-containing protein n=1 Tax=Dendrobium thyrsiflorum TaxID=117978 RepID=A0ABD0VJY9_DENTH